MTIDNDSLVRYAHAPKRLEAAVDALAEGDLDTERAPGEWTVRQLVHHIAEGDILWAGAIRAALRSPDRAGTGPLPGESSTDRRTDRASAGRLGAADHHRLGPLSGGTPGDGGR